MEEFTQIGSVREIVITDTGDFYPPDPAPMPDTLTVQPRPRCVSEYTGRVVGQNACEIDMASLGNSPCADVCLRATFGGRR